ncbi:molybdopterin-dependent oxidoreductase [Vreelandella vilamensis]|nr:molybdopterin-dependent oxidoreductase [Halomonas vilamensis]
MLKTSVLKASVLKTVVGKTLGWGVIVLMLSTSQGLAHEESDANALPLPQGPVILTITGALDRANVGDEAHFDRAMLKALPQHDIRTDTPWTDQAHDYRGPLMRELLAHVGAQSEHVFVAALNGYDVQIPTDDFVAYDVLLAMESDGKPMPIREYGPLWVLYPFDYHNELLSEKMRFRAVWQVMRIDVL